MLENCREIMERKNYREGLWAQALEYLTKLENLLLSYGAKSLHLFPIKGLPGYVEEDMKEWNITIPMMI
jgi:hypothetical protein